MRLARFARHAVGIAPDFPQGKRFWIDDSNMRYTDEGLRPLPGQYFLAPSLSSFAVTGMMEVYDENEDPVTPVLYYGDSLGLFEVINGTVYGS